MARKLTNQWREALDLTTHCRVIRPPQLVDPCTIHFLLEDGAGQRFIFQLRAKGLPSLSGNILIVNATFEIDAFEPMPGEQFMDITF